jgi:hypothetical protein
MIAVLEPNTEDPIAAIRERHCKEAIETLEQAKAIFRLRGEPLPERYEKEFARSQMISMGHFTETRQLPPALPNQSKLLPEGLTIDDEWLLGLPEYESELPPWWTRHNDDKPGPTN